MIVQPENFYRIGDWLRAVRTHARVCQSVIEVCDNPEGYYRCLGLACACGRLWVMPLVRYKERLGETGLPTKSLSDMRSPGGRTRIAEQITKGTGVSKSLDRGLPVAEDLGVVQARIRKFTQKTYGWQTIVGAVSNCGKTYIVGDVIRDLAWWGDVLPRKSVPLVVAGTLPVQFARWVRRHRGMAVHGGGFCVEIKGLTPVNVWRAEDYLSSCTDTTESLLEGLQSTALLDCDVVLCDASTFEVSAPPGYLDRLRSGVVELGRDARLSEQEHLRKVWEDEFRLCGIRPGPRLSAIVCDQR